MSCSAVKNPRAFRGVPTYFRAGCWEAAHGRNEGYSSPGWHLQYHMRNTVPYDVDTVEWEDEVGRLVEMIERGDQDGVERWYLCWFPRCMALVPKRRRSGFLRGVFAAELRDDREADDDDDEPCSLGYAAMKAGLSGSELEEFFRDFARNHREQQLREGTIRTSPPGRD